MLERLALLSGSGSRFATAKRAAGVVEPSGHDEARHHGTQVVPRAYQVDLSTVPEPSRGNAASIRRSNG